MASKDTYYKQIKICRNNSNLSTKRLSHHFHVLIFVALFPNFTFSHQFQHVLSHQVMDPLDNHGCDDQDISWYDGTPFAYDYAEQFPLVISIDDTLSCHTIQSNGINNILQGEACSRH